MEARFKTAVVVQVSAFCASCRADIFGINYRLMCGPQSLRRRRFNFIDAHCVYLALYFWYKHSVSALLASNNKQYGDVTCLHQLSVSVYSLQIYITYSLQYGEINTV